MGGSFVNVLLGCRTDRLNELGEAGRVFETGLMERQWMVWIFVKP